MLVHDGEMEGKEMHGKINRGQGSQNGLQANRLKAGSQQKRQWSERQPDRV